MDGGLPGLPSMPGVCTHIKSTALQGRPYVWLPWEMQQEAFSLTLEPRSALCYGFFCLFQCINISFGWSDSLLFQDLCMCVLTYVCICLKMYVGIYCLFLCMCLTECWVCHICAGTPGEARRGHQSPCSWSYRQLELHTELQAGCSEVNLGPLQVHCAFNPWASLQPSSKAYKVSEKVSSSFGDSLRGLQRRWTWNTNWKWVRFVWPTKMKERNSCIDYWQASASTLT